MLRRHTAGLKIQCAVSWQPICIGKAVDNGATDGSHVCRKLVQCRDQQSQARATHLREIAAFKHGASAASELMQLPRGKFGWYIDDCAADSSRPEQQPIQEIGHPLMLCASLTGRSKEEFQIAMRLGYHRAVETRLVRN